MILKTFEYRVYPNKTQKKQIAQHFGCCRWVYNYALAKKIKAWAVDKKNLSRFDIQKDLPILKKTEETKWLGDVTAQSLQSSLEHLDMAYTRFFKTKKGFPKFKSKHNHRQSCSFPQNTSVDFENSTIRLPKIKKIKAKFDRTFIGKIKTVTLKKTPTEKYFISILVETDAVEIIPNKIKESTTLGIDLGIKDFIVTSNGDKIANPKILQQYEMKLKRTQRHLSRKVKGSKNRNKQRIKLAKVHEKITNIKKDFLHKLSYNLTHDNQVDSLVIENLDIVGMLKNHCLAKSISSCGWGEFTRQLKYKSKWYGKNLIVIGRFEPSSKLCSNCGEINHKLQLKDRTWICENCHIEHDRDINAAINIKTLGLNPKILVEREEFTLVEN